MLFGLGMDGVRPWADQRQVAGENDIEELWQFVEAGLADETADAGDARVVLGDELARGGVGMLDIHRAKFVDFDESIVEAVAALLEEDRSLAVELDGYGDQQHDRYRANQRQRADDLIEQPFHHDVPVRDRPVKNIEHWDVADIGI